MKLTKFLLVLLLSSSLGFSQQAIKVGLHGGLPLDTATDNFAANIMADVDVVLYMTRKFQVGPTAGLSIFLHPNLYGENADNLTFVPVGGMAQFNLSYMFAFSSDIGYGIVLSPDFINSGIYLAPKGHVILSENFDIVLAYRALLGNDDPISSLTIGIEYGFY